MKILITGICGFIGSHLAEMAVMQGHTVIGLDLLTYAGRSANLADLPAVVHIGDICDAATVAMLLDVHQPDVVFHLAAETHVARSIQDREAFLRTNVIGTDVLLSECLKYWNRPDIHDPFRFIQVSTDEVYGSLGPADLPWTESSPYLPNNPYAASKAAGDHLARSYYRTYGLPVIVTHSANNYGPRQHPEKLIPTLIQQVLKGEPMTLHGDGKHIRDWLHVEDHCQGLLDVCLKGIPGVVYNFGGQCERTNREIATLVARKLNADCVLKSIPDRPGNDRRYSSSILKAYSTFGWRPRHAGIERSLTETVQWYLDNLNYDATYGH